MSSAFLVVAALLIAPIADGAPVGTDIVAQTGSVRIAQASIRKQIRRSRCDWQRKVQGRRCWPNPGSHPKRRSSGGQASTITRYADPQAQFANPQRSGAEPKRVRVEPAVAEPKPAEQVSPPRSTAPAAEERQSFWAWLIGFFL